MGETIERPELDQGLAKRYVEMAADELSSWDEIPEDDREGLFFKFARKSLSLFDLSSMRPLGSGETEALSVYVQVELWLGGWGIDAGEMPYDHSDPEVVSRMRGGIMLHYALFSGTPVVPVEVFAHACVDAIQMEIDGKEYAVDPSLEKFGAEVVTITPEGVSVEPSPVITLGPDKRLDRKESYRFHLLVAEEMKNFPVFSRSPPPVSESSCGFCGCTDQTAARCRYCWAFCCEECFRPIYPDGTGICTQCHYRA